MAVPLPDARYSDGGVLSYAAAMTATVNSAPKRGPLLEKALAVGNRAGIKAIPHLPSALKRLLSGGRPVTIDGNTLDPSIQMVAAARRLQGLTGFMVGDDPVASRLQTIALARSLDEPDIHVAATSAVSIPGPAGVIPARHYRPAGDASAPLLVFYHGGGYVIGGLESYDAACRLICRDAGVHVLSVDYRLAPEHKAPAAIDDGYAAYQWACEHAAELGADPDRVAVGGDSAGGNLAAVVALRARDDGDPMPALQWLIYPVTDLARSDALTHLVRQRFPADQQDMDSFTAAFLGGSGVDGDGSAGVTAAGRRSRRAAACAGDHRGLRPAARRRRTVRRRDCGTRVSSVDARQMRSMIHVFLNLNVLGGKVARANAEMISALRAHLARG